MDEENSKQNIDREEVYKTGKRKGRLQGAIIAACIFTAVIAIAFVWKAIFEFTNYGTQAKLAKAASHKESIVSKEVKDKTDVLTAVIDEYYLNEYTDDELTNGLYKGVLEGLNDPYSVYYTKEEFDELLEDAEGSFEGIGAYLSQDPTTKIITVVRPIDDSPAQKVGILAGDIIAEVDGEDISGQDVNLVVSKIKGEAGSKVNIGIVREGETDMLYFDIVRARVENQTVSAEMLEGNIGYLQIAEFNDKTYGQFIKYYNKIANSGMKGLVLDLRSNPGGNVDSVVSIADEFLPEGVVVYTIDKNGNREDFNATDGVLVDVPIVVLVDGNSASAAEILVGALKDYDKCTVVGTTTYGKGIVQSILPLGDGTGVKVTIAKYYTPKGNDIHTIGIDPDIEIEWDEEAYEKDETDNQLDKAIEVLKEKMK